MSPMRDGTGQTTSKDGATQLLICEPLSFAMMPMIILVEMGIMSTMMMVIGQLDNDSGLRSDDGRDNNCNGNDDNGQCEKYGTSEHILSN